MPAHLIWATRISKNICTSVNDVIVHGIPSDDVILKDGDIVNVDLTAEYKGFHGDASRMFMIGNVAPRARELVQTCQDALNAAIAVCAPGVPLSEIGRTIEAVVTPHGFSISRDLLGMESARLCMTSRKFIIFMTSAGTR